MASRRSRGNNSAAALSLITDAVAADDDEHAMIRWRGSCLPCVSETSNISLSVEFPDTTSPIVGVRDSPTDGNEKGATRSVCACTHVYYLRLRGAALSSPPFPGPTPTYPSAGQSVTTTSKLTSAAHSCRRLARTIGKHLYCFLWEGRHAAVGGRGFTGWGLNGGGICIHRIRS
jgi:hypothetical protein